ncbi:hypothetical protein [Caldicellulosiruptor changbaiensis]|uniref:hypothetical protein n=1 Tax=Caldicellulosiruptor changbaiensis TaxID=1222016 RepID=UPI0019D06E04|nr:hypothetical protein [Caldicellulosiruptor changbaiensis]
MKQKNYSWSKNGKTEAMKLPVSSENLFQNFNVIVEFDKKGKIYNPDIFLIDSRENYLCTGSLLDIPKYKSLIKNICQSVRVCK